MELRSYLEVLRRRWWILLLVPSVAALAAFVLTKQTTPMYRATATILVNQTQAPGVVQYNDVLTSERLTNTYAEIVERSVVLQESLARLGLPISEEALADKITVTTVRNTQLLRITAEDADPDQAASIANIVSQVFINDNASQVAGRPGTVSITNQAKVPLDPASPNLRLNLILGVVLGVMMAGVVVVVQEYLDDTVKSPDDIESAVGLPTFGVVSRFVKAGKDRRLNIDGGAALDVGEAFRQIRTNVHFAQLAGRAKRLLITSGSPGEGKSTTAAHLAAAIASAGESVIIVDTDLRRPTQHLFFGVPNSFGLTGVLLSEVDSPEAGLIETGVKGLRVLPSGPLPPNPSELLTSANMRGLVEKLGAMADYVIFDSPPLFAVTDASILASETDGTILVLDVGHTRSEALRRASKALEQAGARRLGVVLNKAKRKAAGAYQYGYYGYTTEHAESSVSESPAPRRAPRREPQGKGDLN